MSRPQQPVYRGHILELDGFRGCATTIVLFAHLWHPSLFSFTAYQLLSLGWMLMDWFFVVSGFLIGGILLDTRGRPDYFSRFYTRRALRILPLYYLLIGLLSIAMYVSQDRLLTRPAADGGQVWGEPWWFFVYLGNLPTAILGAWPLSAQNGPYQDYFAGGSFGPLWSLQLEEQFYLLLPLALAWLRPSTLRSVLILAIPFSLVMRVLIYFWVPSNELVQYVLLVCRLDGFALGVLIAMRFRAGPWDIPTRRLDLATAGWLTVALAAAVYGGFSHHGGLNRTLGFFLSSVASAHVVVWMIMNRDSRRLSLLRSAPVQFLGKISYGVYLTHAPIIAIFGILAATLGYPMLGDALLVRLAVVPLVTVAVATASWTYFEQYFLRLKERPAKQPASLETAAEPAGETVQAPLPARSASAAISTT